MRLFKGLKIWIVVVLLCSPLFSLAQYKFEILPFFRYFKDPRRWEIQGNYMLTKGTFNGVVPVYGYNNVYLTDSTMKRDFNSQPGFGGSIGCQVPFAAMGHISVLAFTVHAMFNYYTWKDINYANNSDYTYKIPVNRLNATSYQLSVPMGLNYKIGCDAIGTKRLKMCASAGGGFMPQLTVTTLSDTSTLVAPKEQIGFTPFVTAEIGVFSGWCVKLKATYTMGNVELMNVGYKVPPYTDGPFKLTTNSQAIFSLVLMPFSHRFRETSWYNDYDSYNWNEKLN